MVQGNIRRDIITLLTRKLVSKYLENPDKIKATSEKDFYKKKEELWNKQVSKLQLELIQANDKLASF